MKKKIIKAFCSVLLMFMISSLQAAEISLTSLNGSGELWDGTKVATGRMVCHETHTVFQIWMNAQTDNVQGHYIVQGKRDRRHEIRVRLEGENWFPSVTDQQVGIYRKKTEEQSVFYIVANGKQYVEPDEYIFTVAGKCS
ncbi:adhesin [Escherichia coli]|nr:adhesin [Escherichia coli]